MMANLEAIKVGVSDRGAWVCFDKCGPQEEDNVQLDGYFTIEDLEKIIAAMKMAKSL
jgi:hypothetical protein